MRKKSPLLIGTALIIAVLVCSCTAGSNNNAQNLHTVCQGFALICQHGGTCGELALGNNQYRDTCTCPVGYGGTYCEVLWRDVYIGTYIGTMSQVTSGSTYPDTITIAATAGDTTMTVMHLYQFLLASPYVPARYDTITFDSYGDAVNYPSAQISFTDTSNTHIHFEDYSNNLGGLCNTSFDGIKQ